MGEDVIRRAIDSLSAAELRRSSGHIREIRGVGLMCAVDVDLPSQEVTTRALEHGLVVGAVRAQTVRILPPLIVEEEEIDEALRRFGLALGEPG